MDINLWHMHWYLDILKKTLTDDEIGKIYDKILKELENKLGAKLR